MKFRLLSILMFMIPTIGHSEVGYRDLRIGMDRSEVEEICGSIEYLCQPYTKRSFPRVGVQFTDEKLSKIIVKVGKFEEVFYVLFIAMNQKYSLDWVFTEQQLELWYSGNISFLHVSYENGTIFIQIHKNSSTEEGEVTVNYLTEEKGRQYVEIFKP